MGLFDDLFKKKQPERKYSIDTFSSAVKTDSVVRKLQSQSSLNEKEESRVVSANEEKESAKEEETLKVTDSSEIEESLQVQIEPLEEVLILYCPIRYAKIYCHSILIDKLGDLTKFIIESLHKGHTINEITELTNMGSITIKEELDYLINGGLVSEDSIELTELGEQYGALLEWFDEISDGIDVAFNVFADLFEPIESEKYIEDPDEEQIIGGQFIPVLARKDNYRNSLDIAKKQITSEIPFNREVKNSLYTTVKIEKTTSNYKPVYIRDFGRGLIYKSDPCITIAIPCDRITCAPRYKWVDQYRHVCNQITSLADTYPELLSGKAKNLISAIEEEDDAEILSMDINTITGELNHAKKELVSSNELPNDQEVYVLERRPAKLVLEEDASKEVYLHDIETKELYQIRYFTYDRMEV